MKITRYSRKGVPTIHVYFSSESEAVTAHADFERLYKTKVGHRNKKLRSLVVFTGVAAVEFLKVVGEPLNEFSDWTPRHQTHKYLRLPDAFFIEDARRFEYRNDWKKCSTGAYQHVKKHRKHLVDQCTAHMDVPCDPFKQGYQVYAYEFENHSVYAGLTCIPKRRHKDHHRVGPVFEAIQSGLAYEFVVYAEGLLPTAAAQAEQFAITQYKADGWRMLNTRHGGEMGQVRTKYNYEEALEAAKKCDTRAVFYERHLRMYEAICRYAWIDRIAQECGWSDHVLYHWTKEKCIENALRFPYLAAWRDADPCGAQAAHKRRWMPAVKALFPASRPTNKWTQERCWERARQFTSRYDWQYKAGDGSYRAARRGGWLKEIASSLYGARRTRWS